MKTRSIIIICVPVLVGLLVLENLISSHLAYKELCEQPYYELYHSYVARDEQYWVFLMFNDKVVDSDNIQTVFRDEFVTETVSTIINLEFGEHPIVVHIIQPSDELPYGWQKSELNISTNMDLSIFHRNTKWRIIIPYAAVSITECQFKRIEEEAA